MLFKHPEFFYYFIVLVFFIFLAIFRFSRRKKQVQKWLGKQSLFLKSSVSDFKRFLKFILELIVLSFLILALARFQGEGEKIEISKRQSSLLLMLDVSHSMLAEDIPPSRLDFAKKELSRWIELSWGEQIALGVFANSAVLISPFTSDLSAVKSYLEDISPEYLSHQGTDFRKLFQFVGRFFKKQRDIKVKVVVIVSDGEDHSSQIEKEVKALLKDQNIRVFTLSVGTKKGGIIPLRDYTQKVREYKKDRSGNLVISKLNPEFLKNLSKWGKGAYYNLDYGTLAIEKLKKDLNLLEKQIFDSYEDVKKTEFYQWFLGVAFLVALIELILTEYKKKKGYKK
ncbi:MAG: VWA domain-containing protein [Bdellovibrionales bacterium]|nr:VWA domain-containing protein [Bdellovibrionales bacterium]